MAKMLRPWVQVGQNSCFYPTYRDVKRVMRNLLNESKNGVVYVTRSRRGQWGEWFEEWQLVNKKPKIVRKTWL